MNEALKAEIAAIAADSRSGATAILERAIGLLREAADDRPLVSEVAEALCRAQPCMAALRVAATLARRGPNARAAIDAFAARTARAPQIIARHAVELLRLRRSTGPLRLVTCSRSRVVERAIRALAEQVEVAVACAEARPALEGRELAVSLAKAGIPVTLYSDAGLAAAIRNAEALLVGADAIGPVSFINKVGTGALAALASVEGVPAYVLAGREKVLPAQAFAELQLRDGPASDVWGAAPEGVAVVNPYFEFIASGLASAFVTDAGVVNSDTAVELARI
jgi:translation initiation factor 2B subunit (eIF-2B alpha/beta/delta family)